MPDGNFGGGERDTARKGQPGFGRRPGRPVGAAGVAPAASLRGAKENAAFSPRVRRPMLSAGDGGPLAPDTGPDEIMPVAAEPALEPAVNERVRFAAGGPSAPAAALDEPAPVAAEPPLVSGSDPDGMVPVAEAAPAPATDLDEPAPVTAEADVAADADDGVDEPAPVAAEAPLASDVSPDGPVPVTAEAAPAPDTDPDDAAPVTAEADVTADVADGVDEPAPVKAEAPLAPVATQGEPAAVTTEGGATSDAANKADGADEGEESADLANEANEVSGADEGEDFADEAGGTAEGLGAAAPRPMQNNRRRANLATTGDLNAPDPEAHDDASAGKSSAAGPEKTATLADAVSPPAAARGADGNIHATPEDRARLAGGAGGKPAGGDAPGPDGAVGVADVAGATGAPGADALKAEEEAEEKKGEPGDRDPLPDFVETADPDLNDLMRVLFSARSTQREKISAEIDGLRLQRSEAMKHIDRLHAQEEMRIQAGAGRKGTFLGSLFAKDSSRDVRAVNRQIDGISEQINKGTAYRRIALDGQFVRTIDAAGRMFDAHRSLGTGIETLNAGLANHSGGKAFLKGVGDAAAALKTDRAGVWDAIHNPADNRKEVSDLREAAKTLYAHPVFGGQIQALERHSREFANNANRFQTGFRNAVEHNGVQMEGVDNAFADTLQNMSCPDANLARPGGQRLDRMKAGMEGFAAKLAESVRSMMEFLGRLLGRGGAAPAP